MTTFRPTEEQERAIEFFRTGESLAIEAGAGTGKTSTLCLLAQATPKRGQYVAFNKALAVEAGSKVPGTVTASTAHSLAFRALGKRYGHRLRSSARMRSTELARRLRLDPVTIRVGDAKKVLAPGFLAGVAINGVERFCQSADPEPAEHHVRYIDGIDLPGSDGKPGWANNREIRKAVLPAMRRAWTDLSDPNGSLPYRHSHYLKAWQLDDPHIGADFILFDEAQDASPVMIDIIAKQTHAQLVWVGDSQQEIYGWAGAVNALAKVPATHRTFLTQSFRFGPAVAEVANEILGRLGAELVLRGSPDVASVVGPVPSPDAILCRTNAMAVSTVLARQAAGSKVHLVGGGTEVVSFAKAAAELQTAGHTQHPELACFESWSEVQSYVRTDEQGGELRLLVGLVDEFGVPTILRALDRMIREDEADVVVSTSHKSKGREWPSVVLGGDFPEPKEGEDQPAAEEMRLLYVSVTRARRELDISAVKLLSSEAEEGPEPAVP